MARRRSRRKPGSNGLGLLIAASAVLLAGAIVVRLIVLVWPLLIIGGAGLIVWKVHSGRKRREEMAEAERLRAIRSREVAAYHQMSASQFEHALAYLCRRDGCPEAIVTGRAGDLGADVIAMTPDGRNSSSRPSAMSPATTSPAPMSRSSPAPAA